MGFPEVLLNLTIGEERDRFEYRPVDVIRATNKQHLICTKLLLGSLDYTQPGLGRSILVSICARGDNVS